MGGFPPCYAAQSEVKLPRACGKMIWVHIQYVARRNLHADYGLHLHLHASLDSPIQQQHLFLYFSMTSMTGFK